MIREEVGRIIKNDVTLIEYEKGQDFGEISLLKVEKEPQSLTSIFAIEMGIVGFNCTEKELKDLYSVLNYYFNIDNFSGMNVTAGGNNVAIS